MFGIWRSGFRSDCIPPLSHRSRSGHVESARRREGTRLPHRRRCHLREHGVTDDELVTLDLAQPSRRGTLIDTFRDRLVVPVSDAHGRITGFVGRDTSGHPEAPKYRNPTHTALFDKSTCL
ncbi:hypothetical protein [Intrasporangium sp.]|uniref:hypothetical protein n=1 Tax=Intrasporangium sp. TaxID=1925024 RepID=UPI0033653FB3